MLSRRDKGRENGTLKLSRNIMVQEQKRNNIFAIVHTILNVFTLEYRTHKGS